MARWAIRPCICRGIGLLGDPFGGTRIPDLKARAARPIARKWLRVCRLPLPCLGLQRVLLAEQRMDLPFSSSQGQMLSAMYLVVLSLGAYVSVAMGQRVRDRGAAERRPWLLTAVMALSTTLWAAAVLSADALTAGPAVGYDALFVGASALVTIALGLPGLHLSLAPGMSRTRRFAGAAALGGAAVAAQVLTLGAAARTLDVGWHPGLLFLAWLAASCGFGWGLHNTRASSEADASPQRQGFAAAIIGSGVLCAHWLALTAAGQPAPNGLASGGGIAAGTLSMLAS
ncbi:MAG: hypothetical protein MUF16_26245, partial [Burkholderiaceae bacterium]|nr:hypothetical protein [Burkholderiaceae bacterium]